MLPDQSWARASENLLEVTILQLVGMNLEAYKNGDISVGLDMDDVREFLAVFNGDWREDRIQHYCCKVVGESRTVCCTSPAKAIQKMKACARKVMVPLFGRAGSGKTKKWCETSRTCCVIGFFCKCHNLMRNASQPWRRKRGSVGDDASEVRADEDPARARYKREKKAGQFWGKLENGDVLIAAAIVTKPVRSLLGHMFAAERNARLHCGSPAVRLKLFEAQLGPTPGHTYLGDFVRRGGYADQADQAMSDLLTGDSLCRTDVFHHGRADLDLNVILTRHRGILLNIWSAMSERMLGPWMDDASFHGLIRMCEAEDPAEAQVQSRAFMSRREGCAEALFVKRVQKWAKEKTQRRRRRF